MPTFQTVQPALAFAATHLDGDLSLSKLATLTRLSPAHFHRAFTGFSGETPKKFALRLRLSRAAALLLTTEENVLDIALSCGFQNHETFSRAFRRHFRIAPRDYRKRGFRGPAGGPRYADLVDSIGPCIGLHHKYNSPKEIPMPYTIETIEIAPQPILLVRKRVKRADISATIVESLGHIFAYTQKQGVALAPGHPLTRYPAIGPGVVTMEVAMRIVSTDIPEPEGPVIVDTLPGGLTATTTHMGAYDSLPNAYAALEVWIEEHGFAASGAPWESYVTDPAEHPDPQNWRTDIFWPIGAKD